MREEQTTHSYEGHVFGRGLGKLFLVELRGYERGEWLLRGALEELLAPGSVQWFWDHIHSYHRIDRQLA